MVDACLATARLCSLFCIHPKTSARLLPSEESFSYYFHDRPNRRRFVLPISSHVTILLGSFCVCIHGTTLHDTKNVKGVKRCFTKRLITLLEMGVKKPHPILSIVPLELTIDLLAILKKNLNRTTLCYIL